MRNVPVVQARGRFFDLLPGPLHACYMTSSIRKPAVSSWRRHPRFHLDVRWFVASPTCSTLGRGLEISANGALLPATCTSSRFAEAVTLYISLPLRERPFEARCRATYLAKRGWVLRFEAVDSEDFQLLGHTLEQGTTLHSDTNYKELSI